MSVTLKGQCVEKTKFVEGSRVKLLPVVGGSSDNESFYKWTPSGEIVFSTINDAAADKIEVGKEYYIELTPAG